MEEPHRARIHRLIGTAEREARDGRAGLADALQRWCWPGGGEDRMDSIARGEVRRSGPRLLDDIAFECTCACGPCELCN